MIAMSKVYILNQILFYGNIAQVSTKIWLSLRGRTLSILEVGRRVFVGVMKYFRHILMGHEIFLKIFDGPRNIFLCSIFVIFLRVLEYKISKLAIKEI